MKVINKLRAFFFHRDAPVELDLVAAEIKEGRAYLHPRGEENVTYMVRSDDIEISLSKGRTITPTDIFKIGDKSKTSKKDTETNPQKPNPDNTKSPNGKVPAHSKSSNSKTTPTPVTPGEFDKYKKRKFVVSLYPDEYDTLMSSMKEYGYKRADFVMACVSTATKGTMEKAHKKIVKSHNEMRKEQQELLTKQQA